MRVKFTCTFSASSYSAPLCLTVSGLSDTELIMTDDELHKSKGMFALKIEGFSMHSNTDPLNTSHRYMLFMRSSKNKEYSADEARCNFYNNETFCNFTLRMRKLKYLEWLEGGEVKLKMAITG